MENYFLKTLHQLRYHEELLLFGRLPDVSPAQQREAAAWLEKAYRSESSTWPYDPPPFDAGAALWAAQLLYTAAQLILHREQRPEDAASLLPAYPGALSPGVMLSADLTLRFLPEVWEQLRLIDPEDALLPLLAERLAPFPYSAIGSAALPDNPTDWTAVRADRCLQALYTDRVIGRRALSLALLPELRPSVTAALGLYAATLWPAFDSQTSTHEPHR